MSSLPVYEKVLLVNVIERFRVQLEIIFKSKLREKILQLPLASSILDLNLRESIYIL